MAEIRLNALLNKSPLETWGVVEDPILADVPSSLEDILKSAEARAPLFKASFQEENHARIMFNRARKEFLPDVGFMGDVQNGAEGGRGYEAGVSLSFPIWPARPAGNVQAARAHMDEAESSARSMRNEILEMTAMEFTETQTHLRLARRLRDEIIPSAETAFHSALRRYESGGDDFNRVMETARFLFSARRDFYDEVYHYGEHWGFLERWAGMPLTEGNP